jgi:hypothetical protein
MDVSTSAYSPALNSLCIGLPMSNWRGYSSLKGPMIFMNTGSKRPIGYPKTCRPFRQAHRSPIIGIQLHRISSIPPLLTSSSPGTILWTIALVIVFTLNRMMLRRSWPHVLKELRKRVSPTVTYRNPSRPVVTIPLCVGIQTTLFHMTPDPIFGMVNASMLIMSVGRPCVLRQNFTIIATARLRLPRFQRKSACDSFAATPTYTAPQAIAILVAASIGNYSQASKRFADQGWIHANII